MYTEKGFFAYIRVSTIKQGTQGVSLQEQRDAIERYAAHNKLTIIGWFEEQETAAKRGRPIFTKMLRQLRRGGAQGVIIHKIDRSARNLKDWADLGELIDRGNTVHFATESLDLASRGGRLSADIQAVVAADYIRNLREETRKGFYGRLKQGLYPLPAPVGYIDCGKGKPKKPDPIKAPLVRKAFELYSTGNFTLHSLCAELTQRGLQNKSGGRLTTSTLSYMLNNPFYAGLVRIRSTGESFVGVHDPLISMALYERVQNRLKGKLTHRVRVHDFLFKRLLHCKSCGRTLTGELQKGHIYYRCHTRGCKTKGIKEEIIEEYVIKRLAAMTISDECADLAIQMAEELRLTQKNDGAEQLRTVKLNRQSAEKKLDRLTDAFLEMTISKDEYERRKHRLLADLKHCDDAIANIKENPDDCFDRAKKFFEHAKSLQLSYISGNSDEKRELLKTVCSNFEIDGKKPILSTYFPYQMLENSDFFPCGAPCRNRFRTRILQSVKNLIGKLKDMAEEADFDDESILHL